VPVPITAVTRRRRLCWAGRRRRSWWPRRLRASRCSRGRIGRPSWSPRRNCPCPGSAAPRRAAPTRTRRPDRYRTSSFTAGWTVSRSNSNSRSTRSSSSNSNNHSRNSNSSSSSSSSSSSNSSRNRSRSSSRRSCSSRSCRRSRCSRIARPDSRISTDVGATGGTPSRPLRPSTWPVASPGKTKRDRSRRREVDA